VSHDLSNKEREAIIRFILLPSKEDFSRRLPMEQFQQRHLTSAAVVERSGVNG
jgi:hypothetical protein